MNPRLNPDLVKDDDDVDGKDHLPDPIDIQLPVTNSICGKPIEATFIPDLHSTNGRHTTEVKTQAAVPETNNRTPATWVHAGGNADSDPAERTDNASDPGDDEIPTGTAQSEQSLGRSITRDSGTAMIDSPYLNDHVEKTSSDRTPSETMLDVPHAPEHARADSSTIGTAETGRYSGSNYDTQAIESSDEEDDAETDITLTATREGIDAGHIPGGFPTNTSEEALIVASEQSNADEQPASGTASTFTNGTAAAVEPLMHDAQLEVSEDFKPAPVNHEEPEEPLVSNEQLGFDDEFKPQMMM